MFNVLTKYNSIHTSLLSLRHRRIWLLGQQEEMRFGQIRKQLALVSSKVLTERLKLLSEHGFVWRKQQDTIPVTVNYGLTPKGKEFASVVELIVQKADDWDAD
ncbi:transcriptional regulator [Vibrio rotiferianus]|nr:transcriptional regulator [Vibrio rotiferianus]ASI95103.1 transcriptional regulator [Vibrio rotiferianus]